jgi:hypothetical protein
MIALLRFFLTLFASPKPKALSRPPSVLALEIPLAWKSTEDRMRNYAH